MERKWIIAIVIITIIVVGGLSWYIFFSTPPEEKKTGSIILLDGQNSTSLVYNPTTVPDSTAYSPHNISNAGDAAAQVKLGTTVLYNNGTQWNKIFNGTQWTISNPNVTVSLVSVGNLTKGALIIQAYQKANEQSSYGVYFTHTDKEIYIKFQYLGDNPTVDNSGTVFTCLYFDGNGNGILDASDKAFNFTNNPNRLNKNMLKVYTPETTSSWQFSTEYGWNETLPNNIPVSIATSSNRKNVTWTIPFNAIGAEKDMFLGYALQAFGYDWYPAGANSTTPNKYARVQLSLPTMGAVAVSPQTTIKFYIKVTFAPTASGNYSFMFSRAVTKFGFEAGEYIKVDYTITGAPSGSPLPQWLKLEFLRIELTNATIRATLHSSDGTESSVNMTVGLTGGGEAFSLSGLILPADSSVGDSVTITGYGTVAIEGETTGTYAGATRTVLYAKVSQTGVQFTYYWDKQTGVMVGGSGSVVSPTGGVIATTFTATETNMWKPASQLPFDPMILYIIIAIVIIAVVAVLLMHRMRRPQEVSSAPS
jgi:hypothetical protein